MPAYGLPGVTTTRRGARIIGIAAIMAVVVAVAAWRTLPSDNSAPSGQISVTLVTDHVGEGIEQGTEVRRDGVKIGTVRNIDQDPGGQRLTLSLDDASVSGLTEGLTIDYAPANLFGITQISMHTGTGGSRLRNGTVVRLTGSDRVRDATTSVLLQSLGQLTGDVLTPRLAKLVAQISRDTTAFAPLLQAVIVSVESIADTQKMPYSPIVDGLGDALLGLPSTLSGGLVLLDSVYNEPYLKSAARRANFDATVGMLAKQLIPSVAGLLQSIRPDYHELAELPVPLLGAVAGSVGGPRTGTDLERLLTRLSRTFHDSPAGPIVNVAVELNADTATRGGRR
ncbi:MCE family protein [Streptomyces sp. SID6673]|nr:MCE family protein [Streptomyces sp. SID11726]NEB24207.1 MCE family protein [Streptomyces sp. SID6673]